MAHTHAAKKALRKSKKNLSYNLSWKGKFKNLLKKSKRTITEKKINDARKNINETIKSLDKAAQKKVITKNKAARLKSRLMRQLQDANKK